MKFLQFLQKGDGVVLKAGTYLFQWEWIPLCHYPAIHPTVKDINGACKNILKLKVAVDDIQNECALGQHAAALKQSLNDLTHLL